ncbi:MAG: ribosome maturation factor RimM [Accumulibacter sp.]|uniref:ribosome maturation factor RimM n=1 Tax=Accumulibacter sp. TaxID=2053492 RepID=UPI002FC350AE
MSAQAQPPGGAAVVADGRPTPQEMVVLGRIGAASGVKGGVHVHPFADDPHKWSTLAHWWLGSEGDAAARWQQRKLIGCSFRNGRLTAQLEGVVDRNAAEALRGVLVGAPRSALPPTAEDEYYWADLLGLAVGNIRNQSLGRIVGLIETPANAVLQVADGTGVERLLPFVAAVVLEVDLAGGHMTVDWEADW